MTAGDLLAVAASATTLIPAWWRLVRVRDGKGLSTGAQLSGLVSSVSWLIYSLLQGLTLSALSSASFVALGLALVALAVRDGERDGAVPVAVIAGSVAAGYSVAGTAGMAVVLGAAPLVQESQQVRALVRGDAPVLSTVAYSVGIARAAAWVPYASEQGDMGLLLWASCTALASGAVLLLLIARRRPGASGSGPRTRWHPPTRAR